MATQGLLWVTGLLVGVDAKYAGTSSVAVDRGSLVTPAVSGFATGAVETKFGSDSCGAGVLGAGVLGTGEPGAGLVGVGNLAVVDSCFGTGLTGNAITGAAAGEAGDEAGSRRCMDEIDGNCACASAPHGTAMITAKSANKM